MTTPSPPKSKRSRPWSTTITSLTITKSASTKTVHKRDTMAVYPTALHPTNKPLATLEEIFKPMQATNSWSPGEIIARMKPPVEPKSPTFITTAPLTPPLTRREFDAELRPRNSRLSKMKSMISLRRRHKEKLVSVDDTARVIQLERHDSAYASRDEDSENDNADDDEHGNHVNHDGDESHALGIYSQSFSIEPFSATPTEDEFDFSEIHGLPSISIDSPRTTPTDDGFDFAFSIDSPSTTPTLDGFDESTFVDAPSTTPTIDGFDASASIDLPHASPTVDGFEASTSIDLPRATPTDDEYDASEIHSQPSSIDAPSVTPADEPSTPSTPSPPSPLLTISIPLPNPNCPDYYRSPSDSLWDEIAITDTKSKRNSLKPQDLNSARNAFRLAYETVSQLQTKNERLPSTEENLFEEQEETRVQLSITGENVRKLRKSKSWRSSRLRSNLELNHPFTPHYARSQALRLVLRGEEDGDCISAAPPPQLPRSCRTCTKGVACEHVIMRDTLRRKKWEEQLRKRVTVCVQVESDVVGSEACAGPVRVVLEREKYQFEADDEEEWMEGVSKSLNGLEVAM